MDLDQQPAEFFYDQAQLALQSGNLKQALSLLQVARQKAPAEQRYRDALEALYRQLEATPGALTSPGVPHFQAGTAGSPTDLRVTGATLPVSRPPSPARAPARPPNAAHREGQASRVFDDAVNEINAEEAAQARRKAAVASPAKRLRTQLIVLGVLAVAGAGFWFKERPRTLEVAGYSSAVPVISATQRSSDKEIVLKVMRSEWDRIPADQRERRVRQLLEIAIRDGYQRVFVYDDHDSRLATASPELIWIAP